MLLVLPFERFPLSLKMKNRDLHPHHCWICHRIGGEFTVSAIGCPVLSRAGVNRARRWRRRQVAPSSCDEPLDEVTEQLVTRPEVSTLKRTRTVPCSSLRKAEGG
jgi:hypothetical protein